MRNIIDKLKILTGRKLSQKEMKSISSRHEPYLDCIYREGDQIIKDEYITQYAITDDISHHGIKHEGDYFVGENLKHYNQDGLLIRKEISRNIPMGSEYKNKRTVYDKPGQFIGKKEERYQKVMEVIKLERKDWLIVEAYSEVNRDWRIKYRVSHISPESKKPLKTMKFIG